MSSLNMASSGPALWTGIPSEDDQRLRELGIAALATMAHPVNDESNLVVNQVVRAVSGNNRLWDQSSTMDEDSSSDEETPSDNTHSDDSVRVGRLSQQADTPTEPLFPSWVHAGESDSEMNDVWQAPSHRTRDENNTLALTSSNSPRWTQPLMMTEYDSPVETYPSSPEEVDEDTKDMLKFYPGEEEYFRLRNPSIAASLAGNAHSYADLNDFYAQVQYDDLQVDDSQVDIGEPPSDPLYDTELQPVPFLHTNTFEHNQTVDEFIERWLPEAHGPSPPPSRREKTRRAINQIRLWKSPDVIQRPDPSILPTHEFFDLQQIPWEKVLRVPRYAARQVRDQWYTSYHNMRRQGLLSQQNILPQTEFNFHGKAMYAGQRATIEHFQLRNLMSVPFYNTVHFSSWSRIWGWVPSLQSITPLIDLSEPDIESGIISPVKISSMKSQLGLIVAGGFCGEYAFASADGQGTSAKGLATRDFNDGITNHVDIIPNRTGNSPTIVLSSNDRHLRILDSETNIFTSDQEMSRPINCSATSPDSRLRVVIGDSPDAWIIEADTGRPVHALRGHRDFGFACAWSPDMRQIATSNQDKTLKIWDARTWHVLETIDSDVAGYRSLRFSPVGGGSRSLLACEPADRISVINAQMYQTREVHEFFGEIAGADFSPDGGHIWVANTDTHFGGFMHYERTNWGTKYGLGDLPNEWLRDDELDEDDRCDYSSRERSLRFLNTLSDKEYDAFRM